MDGQNQAKTKKCLLTHFDLFDKSNNETEKEVKQNYSRKNFGLSSYKLCIAKNQLKQGSNKLFQEDLSSYELCKMHNNQLLW